MANVQVQGVFMGANVKTTTFDGKSKTKLQIDIYQPDSESNDKSITIKTDEIDLLNKLNKDYAIGSVFKADVTVTAYKNNVYYNLQKLVG